MKETECLGAGLHCTPQRKFPNRLVFKGVIPLALAVTLRKQACLRSCESGPTWEMHKEGAEDGGERGASSFPHMMILCGAPLLATCEALSLGLRSLQVHRTS